MPTYTHLKGNIRELERHCHAMGLYLEAHKDHGKDSTKCIHRTCQEDRTNKPGGKEINVDLCDYCYRTFVSPTEYHPLAQAEVRHFIDDVLPEKALPYPECNKTHDMMRIRELLDLLIVEFDQQEHIQPGHKLYRNDVSRLSLSLGAHHIHAGTIFRVLRLFYAHQRIPKAGDVAFVIETINSNCRNVQEQLRLHGHDGGSLILLIEYPEKADKLIRKYLAEWGPYVVFGCKFDVATGQYIIFSYRDKLSNQIQGMLYY